MLLLIVKDFSTRGEIGLFCYYLRSVKSVSFTSTENCLGFQSEANVFSPTLVASLLPYRVDFLYFIVIGACNNNYRYMMLAVAKSLQLCLQLTSLRKEILKPFKISMKITLDL